MPAAFHLAFTARVAALRVLIVCVYEPTAGLLLPMPIPASSTGFLVLLAPTGVSPAQETLWYAAYAAALWAVALVGSRATRAT